MKNKEFPHRLYLVTDEAACLGRDLLWVVEEAVKGGVDLVQLREKHLADYAFLLKARRLKSMLDKYDIPLVINDNLGVAKQCQARGIHVGNTDVPPLEVRKQWPECGLLGYSIEYEKQLASENSLVSDCLALSPVFSTGTKTDTVTEWKLEGVSRIRALTTKPLIAIGGITMENAAEVIRAGADCIAVVSAICSAKDPAGAAAQLRNAIEKAYSSR
ncbi:thiamine-phosphate diphosphorylase [Arcticibacter tournemirensis]|uniref:Thiamine-phosphate synthase n=1 Tax=Arcticibacter tournemirensis TaxID=699437 RepID=A0A4Q0MBI5_9SPHI|nr:thiamine phosphate synthase [Arcticibacter tournemirensis]KAA8483374.1 thiamine phosphate synthase [Arcticibacter tournemirensis]RXF70678.1 thiamine phosphate synthase [Arcticibacter tournemirensis]TQM50935.1 thiamine-phosphate diphosphorylase [Arcticibacter tournemirensis]